MTCAAATFPLVITTGLRLTAMIALLLGGPVGCMSMRETFEDERPEYVWAALVAVAETPDYHDDEISPGVTRY